MTKRRVARMERLVSLRLQERRQREQEHAAAQRQATLAREAERACEERCADLDRQRDECLCGEVAVEDLAMISAARAAAAKRLRAAAETVAAAVNAADAERARLLGAHKAHRSLEILHDKQLDRLVREDARHEQRELDDIAIRSAAVGRSW